MKNYINTIGTPASTGGGGSSGILAEIDPTVPSWAKQPQKPTYTAKEVGAETSMTYTAEEWKALSDEEKEIAKQTYDTIYITGDVSDWCEKPVIATTYPSNNTPADNTIYNLGERAELTIASIPEHCCASITVTAGADGLTLGIAEGVKIIGSLPTTEGGKEYFVGIVDGMLYVDEVSVYSTEEGA